MDAKAIIDLLLKSKSTVNAIQALESIYDVVTDRTQPSILGPFSTPVAKAVSNQLILMIKRDPDALCSSYEAAISLKALCLSLVKSISAWASNAASLADVRLTIVQSGLMRSIVEACAELYQRVHEQSREVLQGRIAGEQQFTALCNKLKHTEEQILQLRTTQADAGPETEQQITQLELQRGQLLQQIGDVGEKYAPTPFVARYIVAGSLLRLWASIAFVWPDKQLLDSHFKPSLFHAAFLCHSVLTLATPVCDQYTRLRTPDKFTNAVMGALRASVVQAAETARAYAAVVSKLAMQISETGLGPQFEVALTQAPELASPAVLHMLCSALAWTALLTQWHLTSAVADSSTSSQLQQWQQQQQVPAHHIELLKVLGCCVLTKSEVRDIAGPADRQDYMQMAALPHALAYCLALRQEEGLARRRGRPTSWPHQLESLEESVPSNLYMPLARQCVEVLMLLDSPDVCFETVKLLYKICYYRGHWRPYDNELKRSQLDFLLLEAAPALVGLVGDQLPKDKSTEAYKALDYFVDVLMRNAAHMVVSLQEPKFLTIALQQQQRSTCVMLEAAIRITATSNEPAIPQHALLQVVCTCCEAAAINAQQQVAAATAATAAGASQGACTPCDVADSTSSGAALGAAAAGPRLPPEVFSLLLSCVKFSTGLLMVLDANAATDNIRNALATVWGTTGSGSSGDISSPAATALRVFVQGLRAGNSPGWHATWLRGGISVASGVLTNSSGGNVRIKAADMASLAPWLNLIGRSLFALGQMIAMFDPVIHAAQGMRSSLSETVVAKTVKLASFALQWLECILDATVQSLQQQQAAPQGQQDDSSTSSSSCSAVARLLLTDKAAQQLLQDCKQLQQLALMYERLCSGNNSAKSRAERIQHAKAVETDLQQQLQQFGPALCAAVPLVYCCNNPECTKLTRVSERQAKGVCSKCKQARYCCNECQAAHWPLHKSTCKLLSKLMPTASNR